MDEGDCDSNHECKSHLFCGSNNCPGALGFLSSVDCCEPRGDKTFLFIVIQSLSISFRFFFHLLTESCAMNYCQDGVQIYFATETQQYTYQPIYGHYELQPNDVKGRPYMKMGAFGFWWNGLDQWNIGLDTDKGQSYGYGRYKTEVFCPHQLSEWHWQMWDGSNWVVDSNVGIKCKCIFIQTKQSSLNFIIKIDNFS